MITPQVGIGEDLVLVLQAPIPSNRCVLYGWRPRHHSTPVIQPTNLGQWTQWSWRNRRWGQCNAERDGLANGDAQVGLEDRESRTQVNGPERCD